jgi:hypothetical protein
MLRDLIHTLPVVWRAAAVAFREWATCALQKTYGVRNARQTDEVEE